MRAGAEIVQAVTGSHGVFDPIHDLRNCTVKDIDHLFAFVADFFRSVARGHVQNKGRQLVTRKIRADLLVGNRRTGY